MKPTLLATGSNRGEASRRLLLAGLLAMAGLAAVSSAGAASAGSTQPGSNVTSVRRSGAAGAGSVGVMRGSRVEPVAEAPSPVPATDASPTLSPSGPVVPDATVDGGPDPLPDTNPVAVGLPDAEEGEPPVINVPEESWTFPDIGVRGERNGRMIKLVGAELAFVDCEVQVSEGTPLGFTGVMGRVGPNAGSAPALRFKLESGGTVRLTVQPLPGNRATPNRPVRTVTMQVP